MRNTDRRCAITLYACAFFFLSRNVSVNCTRARACVYITRTINTRYYFQRVNAYAKPNGILRAVIKTVPSETLDPTPILFFYASDRSLLLFTREIAWTSCVALVFVSEGILVCIFLGFQENRSAKVSEWPVKSKNHSFLPAYRFLRYFQAFLLCSLVHLSLFLFILSSKSINPR